MNLIKICLNRPVLAWMMMSALIIFGAISLSRLGVSQMPDVDFPVLNISVNYQGASPEVMEAEIVEPIEKNLLFIEGIEEVKSVVKQGSANILITFNINRNIDTALQDVQTALGQIRFPESADPPTIRKRNPEESPIMFIGVAADKPLREILNWTENSFLDEIRFIEGIGEVSINGVSSRNLRIWPDLQKLKNADMTISDILDAIATQHQEASVGQFIEKDQEESRVRWLGETSTAQELSEIRILRRGGQVIQDKVYQLKDVAIVEDGLSDLKRISRIDGKEALSISILKQRGVDEVKLAKRIHQKIKQLKKNLPESYHVKVNIDFTLATEAVVNTTFNKLLTASIITILICFLFLGNFQSAINILFSIPTSILGTFIVVYFSGFTLNLFTLLALTLAISIVIDDAIMLLENIIRHSRMGKSPYLAAYEGSMEILPAATAATLAVVAVFLPVVFMEGVTGKFFFQFGITMSAAVILSLIEAITITPMRAAALMKNHREISPLEKFLDEKFEIIAHSYLKILRFSLRHPKKLSLLSIFFFIGSLYLTKDIKKEFIPDQDQNFIMLNVDTPTGTPISQTFKKALEIEKKLQEIKDIDRFFFTVGGGSETNQIMYPIFLVDRQSRKKNHREIMDEIRNLLKNTSEIKISLRDNSSRGLTSGRQNPVAFNLRGGNLDILQQASDNIIKQLEEENLAQDLNSDFKLGLPELLISPDRNAMAQKGVSIDNIAKTLSATIGGIRQNQFTSEGRRYDIRIKIKEDQLKTIDDIKSIEVRNSFGIRVPLSQLVKFEITKTYQSISRINRQRSISIFGNLVNGKSQSKVLDRAEQLAKIHLPEGYLFTLEGSAAGLTESINSFALALLLGIIIAYMILASQFNSFIHPITILMALPFSLSGALMILWLTDLSINLYSLIGIIVLMGIAKKNSILLVEFTNHIREKENKSVTDSILQACPIRLRPILMTSIATIAAALPLIIGNTLGQETRTPMGLTIIGGTIISTVFTLIVVPCFYFITSNKTKLIKE